MITNGIPSYTELEERNVDQDKVLEIFNWLRLEFAKIDASTYQMKSNRILEAARKLEELNYPKRKIAATLAQLCEQNELASRAMVYRVLPIEYKDRRRSEGTMRGIAVAAQPLLVDVPCMSFSPWVDYNPKEGEQIRKFRLNDYEFQSRLRQFNELMWSAQSGKCEDCSCLNCRALRGMPFL